MNKEAFLWLCSIQGQLWLLLVHFKDFTCFSMTDLGSDKKHVQVVRWLSIDQKGKERKAWIYRTKKKSIKYCGTKWVFNWVVSYAITSSLKDPERLTEKKCTSSTWQLKSEKAIEKACSKLSIHFWCCPNCFQCCRLMVLVVLAI